MRITQVTTAPFELAYPGGGYTMSHVHLTRLTHRVIRITTENGDEGYGEIARRSAAEPTSSTAREDELLPDLQGALLTDLPDMLARWRAMDDKADRNRAELSLAAAVEMAFLDLIGRQSGLPLSTLLGGPATGTLPAYGSLPCIEPEALVAKVTARPHHPVIQAKLGTGTLEEDLARLRAVLGALGPGQLLLADFNGALDLPTAREAIRSLQDDRLMWEDPCLSYEDNATLVRELGASIMFDMCMSSVEMFVRAIRDDVAAAVVIKPPFMGGLSAARTARDLSAAAGLKMRIDGPWSGPLAAVANLHLALGAPKELLLASADLTDPFEESYDMIRHPAPGHVAPGPGPGLGVLPPDLFQGSP